MICATEANVPLYTVEGSDCRKQTDRPQPHVSELVAMLVPVPGHLTTDSNLHSRHGIKHLADLKRFHND
jgi:hypothetical protein